MTEDSYGSFIVVTGDPNRGHGERLGQARSHLASRYHQRRRQQNKIEKPRFHKQTQAFLSLDALSSMPKEVRLALDAPRLPASPTGYRRMQKFMYEYVHYGHLLHPFFSTVICAAVSHPALMSSKILNASAWDDLSVSGEISDLTLQQCVITRKLLDDSLGVGEEACSDVTIAALVALILFDLVNDEKGSLYNDQKGIQRIVSLRGGESNLGFGGHLRIEQLQRVAGAQQCEDSLTASRHLPSVNVDMDIFTLGNQQDKMMPFIPYLSDIYQAVALSRYGVQYRENVDHSYGLIGDARIPALEQAKLIFNMAICTRKGDDLLYEILHLKALLQHTDLSGFWGSLPGALIWCLVIGARLSHAGHLRKWFMMQTTRLTCAMAMSSCDAVLENLRIVLEGLDMAKISTSGGPS